jgi:hypothetical protein
MSSNISQYCPNCESLEAQLVVARNALAESKEALMHYEWFANPASNWALDQNKTLRQKVDNALSQLGETK